VKGGAYVGMTVCQRHWFLALRTMSGRIQLKYSIHGRGMPALRHSLTDGCLIPHSLAVAAVPPSPSMIALAILSMFQC